MKTISSSEQKTGMQSYDAGSTTATQAVNELFSRIEASGVKLDHSETANALDQLIVYLNAADIDQPLSYDLKKTSWSIPYFFGDFRVTQYPIYSAHRDSSSSILEKARLLKKRGVPSSVVQRFRVIANPEWGNTLRGLRFDEKGVHYLLDRTKTYNPLRQELRFSVNSTGKITWGYSFTVYDPADLDFWIPNDTMGVSTPEFKSNYTERSPIHITGSVATNGKLLFEKISFGDTIATHGNPNYTVKGFRKDRISLKQDELYGFAGSDPYTDFEVRSVTFANVLQYIRQQDHTIDTNPLFPVQVKKRKSRR